MKIALASDHGGFALKEQIKGYLAGRSEITLFDLGTNSEESVDYPVYGRKLAGAVASGEADLGIAFCGTGIGISIACNKASGIRCALCTDPSMAEMARRHNDANILALGGRTTSLPFAEKIVDKFLETGFEGGRHKRRVEEITDCLKRK
jgi:ribose 5-phosphate isomerase B